jgi:cell division protease FtsH
VDKFDLVDVDEAAKNKLRKLVSASKNPELYERLGVPIPRSLLFESEEVVVGRKLAEAFIAESGLPSFVVERRRDDPEFLDRVRKNLDLAKGKSPSILLIDGVDPSNGRKQDVADVDGLLDVIEESAKANVFVIINLCVWCISLSEMTCDASALGDIQIFLKGNDEKQDLSSVKSLFGKFPCVGIEARDITGMLENISRKDYPLFFKQAAYHAALDGRSKIEARDFVSTLEEETVSCPASSLSEEAQRKFAIHEAGHLLIDEMLNPGSIGFVHLGDDGERLGYCVPLFEGKPIDQILGLMGGKASVEIAYGGVATGCDSDLEKAEKALTELLQKEGYQSFSLLDKGVGLSGHPTPTKEQNIILSYELERCLNKAKELIATNREFLDAAMKKLQEQGYLLASEIERMRKEHPLDDSPLRRFC